MIHEGLIYVYRPTQSATQVTNAASLDSDEVPLSLHVAGKSPQQMNRGDLDDQYT